MTQNQGLRRWVMGGVISALLVAIVVVSGFWSSTVAQERPDLKPYAKWDFTREAPAATLPVSMTRVKPHSEHGLVFNDPRSRAVVLEEATAGAAFLPQKAISIASWVRVDQPQEWSGFLSCFQDNGSFERGFIVGADKTNFFFGLATKGHKVPGEIMSYHRSKAAYTAGQWYHVVAVYDGNKTQIFINGELDSEETKQSSDIWYAEKAKFVVGRYQDDNEDFPLNGAIREIQFFHRPLISDEIKKDFTPLAKLAQPQPAKPTFVVEPYLQSLTKTSVVIMAEAPTPMTSEVTYGTSIPLETSVKNEKASTMQELTLEKLQPGTKYFYQVTCRGENGVELQGPIGTFQTAPEMTQAFAFSIIGDTQRNPVITGKVAKLMWEDRPNFVLHMGDVVDNGPDKREWTQELFKPCQELFGRVCLFPCIGNHEKNHAHYYQYFSLPKPEFYYSYTYGHAEFFSIDTNKPVGPGSAQYEWLDKALGASKAKWKFCYHHHPCYSSDSDDYGNSFKGETKFGDRNARQLVALYEKHNVDIAMNGHIHVYERTHPIRDGKINTKNGVVYLTSGGGGGSLENFSPVPAYFKNQHKSTFHYCHVSIVENTLRVKAVDSEGRLFDQWEIQK
ncbi:MAG: LamG-like jellyroll fold domain-containing protein [Fimbriiglobus sp.]